MTNLSEIILLAISLSVDAMVAAICIALCKKDINLADGIKTAAYFGVFQALMPLIGYLLGSQLRHIVQPVDHWIILTLLLFIGLKMIWESRQVEGSCVTNPCSHSRLFLLAIATSLDALAVGISLSLTRSPMLLSSLIIGITTFLLSLVGVRWGQRLGSRFRSLASITGGVLLIFIGIKVVVEHLTLGI